LCNVVAGLFAANLTLKGKKKSNPKAGQIFVSKVLISEALLVLDLVVVGRQAGHREGDEDPDRG
jgi:hypothetical protein